MDLSRGKLANSPPSNSSSNPNSTSSSSTRRFTLAGGDGSRTRMQFVAGGTGREGEGGRQGGELGGAGGGGGSGNGEITNNKQQQDITHSHSIYNSNHLPSFPQPSVSGPSPTPSTSTSFVNPPPRPSSAQLMPPPPPFLAGKRVWSRSTEKTEGGAAVKEKEGREKKKKKGRKVKRGEEREKRPELRDTDGEQAEAYRMPVAFQRYVGSTAAVEEEGEEGEGEDGHVDAHVSTSETPEVEAKTTTSSMEEEAEQEQDELFSDSPHSSQQQFSQDFNRDFSSSPAPFLAPSQEDQFGGDEPLSQVSDGFDGEEKVNLQEDDVDDDDYGFLPSASQYSEDIRRDDDGGGGGDGEEDRASDGELEEEWRTTQESATTGALREKEGRKRRKVLKRGGTMNSVGHEEEEDAEEEKTGKRWEKKPSHPLHQAQTQTFSRSASPSLSQSRHHSATPANSFDPPHPLHTTDQSRSRSLSPSQALPAAPRPVNPLASIPSIYPNEQHPFLKHAAALLENREAEQCGDGEVKEWKIAGEGFVERFKDAVEKVGGLLEQQFTRHSLSLSSLSSHTTQVEARMEKLEETRKRLEGWGGMVLGGGGGSGGGG